MIVVILSGGITDAHTLRPWTQARVERALELDDGACSFITTSAYSPHVRVVLDEDGLPVREADVMATVLAQAGVAPARIFAETTSMDTIGNAYFTLVQHLFALGDPEVVVVTSAFHMPRSEAIFRWILGLVDSPRFQPRFVTCPDRGLTGDALAARRAKEARGRESVAALAGRLTTLPALHRWLFQEHDAYAPHRSIQRAQGDATLSY